MSPPTTILRRSGQDEGYAYPAGSAGEQHGVDAGGIGDRPGRQDDVAVHDAALGCLGAGGHRGDPGLADGHGAVVELVAAAGDLQLVRLQDQRRRPLLGRGSGEVGRPYQRTPAVGADRGFDTSADSRRPVFGSTLETVSVWIITIIACEPSRVARRAGRRWVDRGGRQRNRWAWDILRSQCPPGHGCAGGEPGCGQHRPAWPVPPHQASTPRGAIAQGGSVRPAVLAGAAGCGAGWALHSVSRSAAARQVRSAAFEPVI